ncbi:hypothetical protein JCM11641_004585 [Rhodosporidiobolus odoratus]
MTASTTAQAPARAALLSTSLEQLDSSLETASSLLQSQLPVAFPTETVYGVGASALSSTAVKRIFAAKGRPSDNPLIVHVGGREMLEGLLPTRTTDEGDKTEIPKMYEALMKKFWPGALSLVFPLPHLEDKKGKGKAVDSSPFAFTPSLTTSFPPPAASTEQVQYTAPRLAVAPEVTASQPSLCIRMPSHPLALRLIQHSNLPLAAPSANLSSRPSPTTAAHVMHDLGEGRGVGAVLDGGECEVGVESTVVDWVAPANGDEGEGALRILRAGGVTAEEIEDCLREAGFSTSSSSTTTGGKDDKRLVQVYARDFRSTSLESTPTTPGMKYKHYAPSHAKVVLVRPISAEDAGPLGPLPSLQDLMQLTALTHTRVTVGTDGETKEERFRVGLMLREETLKDLGATALSSTCSCANPQDEQPERTPSAYSTVSLPPPPPSLFATLSLGESSNLPSLSTLTILSYPLGSRTRPIEAAQRLFSGLRLFDELPLDVDGEAAERGDADRTGVDLILVEAVEEEGVGLAVMERARKAAGGIEKGGEMEFALP